MTTTDRFGGTIARPELGIPDYLDLNGQQLGDSPCFVRHDGSELGFDEVVHQSRRMANGLREMGVGMGDAVSLIATDSIEYVVTLIACMRVGAVAMPLNFRLTVDELQHLLVRGSPRVVFASPEYVEIVRRLQGEIHTIENVVIFGEPQGRTPSFDDVLQSAYGKSQASIESRDERIVMCTFTSGTTGRPKGVLQSQRMLKALIWTLMLEYEVGKEEFRYAASPLFHIAGLAMTLMGLVRGFPALILPQFDPEAVVEWLQSDQITSCQFVPTTIAALLRQPGVREHKYERLRSIVYGAEPMSPALLGSAMRTFDCDFYQGFGAGTEAGVQTVLRSEDHRRAREGAEHLLASVGRPAAGVDLRICDDEGRDVERGEVGEILTKSEMIMSGYLDMDEAEKPVTEDGWFAAGDLAVMDGEGYVYLRGRKGDVIVRGGENVSPIEIENVLESHPAVAAAAVIGVPDKTWGEVPLAFIETNADQPFEENDVLKYCRQSLAKFKVPQNIRTVECLPRNAAGKIMRRVLRAEAEQRDDDGGDEGGV